MWWRTGGRGPGIGGCKGAFDEKKWLGQMGGGGGKKILIWAGCNRKKIGKKWVGVREENIGGVVGLQPGVGSPDPCPPPQIRSSIIPIMGPNNYSCSSMNHYRAP